MMQKVTILKRKHFQKENKNKQIKKKFLKKISSQKIAMLLVILGGLFHHHKKFHPMSDVIGYFLFNLFQHWPNGVKKRGERERTGFPHGSIRGELSMRKRAKIDNPTLFRPKL